MGSISEPPGVFRKYLPDLSSPRFTTARKQNAYEYAEAFERLHQPPWLYDLTKAWEKLLEEPYKGLTSDGFVREDLFHTQDEALATETIVSRANELLASLDADQLQRLSYAINAREWRAWSNPEFLLRPFGLRLDEQPEQTRHKMLKLVESSLSPEGFQKALSAMRINGFLGQLCHMDSVMNEHSYNFLLFGKPSVTESWGWSMYGHHLCLSVFLKGQQIVISPSFTGAEPNEIDAGPYRGTKILHQESETGLRLMQSLSPEDQQTAQIYELMHDPRMEQTGDLCTDRWNKDDQRHLCGAFRDNRIVPYEGLCVAQLGKPQQHMVLDIAEQFLLYLPSQARVMKKESITKHFDETYFCWIGGFGDGDAFYYRVQSPVVVFEFDHHSGVFLTNEQPAKFHTHTIVRTPNAGDYGNALRSREEKLH